MTRPTKIIANCTTGERTVIELTDEELEAQIAGEAIRQAEITARQAEAERIEGVKLSARAKLVAGEPLTEEEAATIVL